MAGVPTDPLFDGVGEVPSSTRMVVLTWGVIFLFVGPTDGGVSWSLTLMGGYLSHQKWWRCPEGFFFVFGTHWWGRQLVP